MSGPRLRREVGLLRRTGALHNGLWSAPRQRGEAKAAVLGILVASERQQTATAFLARVGRVRDMLYPLHIDFMIFQ
jgi:hypothetical protein